MSSEIKRYGGMAEGSAILLVMLFMTFLSLCSITFWYSSSLLHDVSLKRLEYEQKYRAAQGGLNYAIDFCSKHFDELVDLCKKENKTFELETSPWNISENISGKNSGNIAYNCNISISSSHNYLHIRSLLFDSKKNNIFEITCNLCANKCANKSNTSKSKIIKNWSIGEK